MERSFKNKKKIIIFTLIILALLTGMVFIAIKIVTTRDYLNSDFFTFWLSGHMIWTGENPYSNIDWVAGHHTFDVTWIPNSKFVYPLPLAYLYAPLGFLPYFEAYIIWVFLLQVMLLGSTYFLINQLPHSQKNAYLFPLFAGVLLFRPSFAALFGGQISIFMFFVLSAITYLWMKEKFILGCALLPIVALKPNIGIPILAILSFWLLIKSRYKELLIIITSSLLLLGIGFFLNPNWIIEYWKIGNTKMGQTFGYSPTVWGLSALLTKFHYQHTVLFGFILLIFILSITLFILFKNRKYLRSQWIISISITVSLLITPYTWPYDQVLLIIPILMIVFFMIEKELKFMLSSTVFLFIDAIGLLLLYISAVMKMEIVNVFLPLLLWISIISIMLSHRKKITTLNLE